MPPNCDKFNHFTNFTEYFNGEIATPDHLTNKRRIIIVDGVKFNKQLSSGDKTQKDAWKAKADVLPEINDNGSHIVAFFATYNDFKRRFPDIDMRKIFGSVVGYCVAPQEWQNLTDDPKISTKLSKLERRMSRATYISSGVVTHFKTFLWGER